jgi:two-component system, LuxR family, sensor kinase FixL
VNETEQYFKTVINTMTDAIITMDEKGIVRTFNPAAEKIFGYAHFEVIGQNVDLLIPEPDRSQHDTSLKNHGIFTEPQAIGVSRKLVGQRKNGTVFSMDLTLSEAQVQNEKIFTGLIRETTNDRQEAEDLQKITEYLDTVLHYIPIGVAILEGPDFRYFRINQALADLNGLTIEDHLGKPLAEVLPNAEDKIIPELNSIIETDSPLLHREFSIKLPSSPDRPVNLIDWQIPIQSSNKNIQAIVSIVVDSTQLTQAQAMLVQSAKLASIGQIAAGLAHEINQPLSVIKGRADFIQLIQKSEQDANADKVSASLNEISIAATRAFKIIKHLKIFSRKDELLEFQKIDINWLINESFVLLDDTLRIAGIDVKKKLAENLPQVHCNYLQLEQVIMNMIANAKDALSESDEKQLVIQSYQRGDKICIEIMDSGQGIPKSIIDKVFDPFFTTKKVGEGTGLGLSISYGIIQDHHGTLTVDSSEGEGSCFTISLPTNLPNRPNTRSTRSS